MKVTNYYTNTGNLCNEKKILIRISEYKKTLCTKKYIHICESDKIEISAYHDIWITQLSGSSNVRNQPEESLR